MGRLSFPVGISRVPCSLLHVKSAPKPKTVRFDALVQNSGKPEQVTLWTKPEDDPDFMTAVHSNRVVTVVQRNVGTKKDFGVVGLLVQKNAAYLIFPKAISAPVETKVIGIKYDRIATAAPKGPIHKPTRKKSPGIPMRETPRHTLDEKNKRATKASKKETRRTKSKREPARKPKLYAFVSTVTLSAVQSTDLTVQAASASAAAKAIRAQAAELRLDPAKARLTHKVSAPRKQKR